MTNFHVTIDDTTTTNILKAPLKATNMGWEADNLDQCEYLVSVKWIDNRPKDQAFRQKGMFANQNVVAKLRQPFTLKLLEENLDAE